MNQLPANPTLVEVAQALKVTLNDVAELIERVSREMQDAERQEQQDRRRLAAIAEVVNGPHGSRKPGTAPEDDWSDDLEEIRQILGRTEIREATPAVAQNDLGRRFDTGHRRWRAGVTNIAMQPSVEEHPNGNERWFAFLENVLKASRDERVALGTGTDGRMAGESLGPQEARMLLRIARAAQNLYFGGGGDFNRWRNLREALGAHGYTNTGALAGLPPVEPEVRFDVPTTKDEALARLAEFARSAPGQLPHHVEEALRIAEGK